MKRRHFSALLSAAIAGMVRGAAALEKSASKDDAKPPGKKPVKDHVCKGFNSCKGKGLDAKNDCKGKGLCASPEAMHECRGKNKCKEMGGCACGDRGCAQRNTCSEKGGCRVPVATHEGFCVTCNMKLKRAGGKAGAP